MTISVTKQVHEVPKDLPPSDFGFDIDYNQDEGPAKRVFGATYRFIEACEECSQALVGSIGISIDPVIVLEDVVAGSIKTRFKIFYKDEGEAALKSGEWKRIIGTFIVEGFKIFFTKTNQDDEQPKLRDMQSELYQLSKGVKTEKLAIRHPIPDNDIIEIVEKFESIKNFLSPSDKAEFLTSEETRVPLLQSVKVNIENLKREATRETLSHHDPGMILIVRKPDYLAESQWLFIYDEKNLFATIEDVEWLVDFQKRKIDVRPGDALQCKVRIEVAYGHNSKVISKRHFIEKVLRVIDGGIEKSDQPGMYGSDESADDGDS